MSYQGYIANNASDSNLIQNVYIDDVRVGDFQLGQLLNFELCITRNTTHRRVREFETL